MYTEDVVYSYLLLVLTSRRVTVKLKEQNIKLATRTKTTVESTEESNTNKRPKATPCIVFGHLRALYQDVNIEKVKADNQGTNFPPTHKQRTNCEEHMVSKSRDPSKGGTEGRGTANCP